MTSTEKLAKKRILMRLSLGLTTIAELNELIKLYQEIHKESGNDVNSLIEWQSYKELHRRLGSSVFGEKGKDYPEGYKRYCVVGEHHNTKVGIDIVKKVVKIGLEKGDITEPSFYGLPDSDYEVSLEDLIHIVIRHNRTMNKFISPDSLSGGYSPSSFGFGVFAEPMMTLFMALRVLEDGDWKKAQVGKNLICHFSVGGKCYTAIRKGESKQIKSFYPRNDDLDTTFVELERLPEKMELVKK